MFQETGGCGGGCLSEALHGWVEIGDKRLEN